jgi:DnaJ homolog subfamily A member 2
MNFFNDFFGREGNPFQKPPFMNGMNGNSDGGNNNDSPVDNERLYNILGVEQTANNKEIRKAYLKKSTKGDYKHPDKGGDEEKFKILVQAYDILKDEEQRKDYDKYGEDIFDSDFQQKKNMSNMSSMFNFNKTSSNSHRNKSMQMKGAPTTFELKLTLEELCENTTKKIRVTRKVVFEKNTNKQVPDDKVDNAWDICRSCNGQGMVMHVNQIRPGMVQQIQAPCDKCNRTGSHIKDEYEIRNTSEIVEIFVEKGSANGDKLTFKNKGNVIPGRMPSDLIINIKQLKHDSYTRKENDLLIKKQITLDEALFGLTFYFYHPDGRTLQVQLNGGITPNNNLRALTGGGMPIKGDSFTSGKLFIYFEIVFPTTEQLAVHETLRQKLKDLLSMIPNYKNPVHKYDFNPSKTQLETVEECSLTEVNMKEFGIRTRSHNKSANDSDSDDEMGGMGGMGGQPQCRQM